MAFPPLVQRRIVRWGIIGCGDVTEVKSGPGFQKANGSQLVAVMRRNGALAADYAKRHGVPRWYDDARALVNDPEVDAVYVATPPGAHLEGALLAAAAGKPCYMEKPMARHTPECDAMIAAFARAKLPLFVAYYRRALPRFVQAKQLLDSGVIGTLTGVNYRFSSPLPANADPANGAWRVAVANSGGGLFLDMGSHVVDLLDFFCGPLPLESVHGDATRAGNVGEVEDTVTLIFRAAGGALGSGVFNFASQATCDLLEFNGTAGRLSLSVFGNDSVRLETARGLEQFDRPNPPHVAQPLIQTIVDDLLGRGTCPSTADSGRRASAVMDRVLHGYYGGRADRFWERAASWARRSPAV